MSCAAISVHHVFAHLSMMCPVHTRRQNENSWYSHQRNQGNMAQVSNSARLDNSAVNVATATGYALGLVNPKKIPWANGCRAGPC